MTNHSNLIIVGAGGFGREVAFAAERAREPLTVGGFVDDRRDSLTVPECWKILGRIADTPRGSRVVIAIGNPRTRRSVALALSPTGVEYARIDVDGSRHSSVLVGRGSILVGGVRLTVNISAGSHFIANLNCTIGHDVVIGDFVTVAPLVAVSGNVRIGDGAEIGTGACVREGVTIGAGALIGMGAVVVKDVPANAVVVGNPARQIKTLPAW